MKNYLDIFENLCYIFADFNPLVGWLNLLLLKIREKKNSQECLMSCCLHPDSLGSLILVNEIYQMLITNGNIIWIFEEKYRRVVLLHNPHHYLFHLALKKWNIFVWVRLWNVPNVSQPFYERTVVCWAIFALTWSDTQHVLPIWCKKGFFK